MICQKELFNFHFLIEHMFGYLLESLQLGDSNKSPKHMPVEVLNALFLHNFSWVKVLCKSNYHCNIMLLYRVSV